MFLELSCFFYDPMDVGNLISGSSAFSKSNLTIWNFSVHTHWTLAWRILSITLLACETSAVVWYFEHSLALPFLGIGMKTDLLQSHGHCWIFQICWHIECNTWTASFFRIWNSSTGILTPPLALFVVMLHKAHLTLHSRMSGSKWMISPSWLSGSLRSWRRWKIHLFVDLAIFIKGILHARFCARPQEYSCSSHRTCSLAVKRKY